MQSPGRERRSWIARSYERGLAILLAVVLSCSAVSALAPVVAARGGGVLDPITGPWVTSARPTVSGFSLHVLDLATAPVGVALAAAELHIWGRAAGPASIVAPFDGVFPADFGIDGLSAGAYVASVSWTPLTLGAATEWSAPVFFTAGGASCSRPPVSVKLPGVDVSYRHHTTKPWGVRYLPLGLTFMPASPASSSTCSLLATGTLQVQIGLLFVDNRPLITIPVHSVATAELDFLRPEEGARIAMCDWVTVKVDCSLDHLTGTVLRWHTEGFSEQQRIGGKWVEVFNSGPLTYYDSVDPRLSFGRQVQTAETTFHLDLIAHLQDVNPVYLIQEPPARLIVTDSRGRVSGTTADGHLLQQIPASASVMHRSGYSAVVLLAPHGSYSATASGPAHSAYSLTLDQLQAAGPGDWGEDQAQATAGRFGGSGRVSVCLRLAAARCPGNLTQLPAVTDQPSVGVRERAAAPSSARNRLSAGDRDGAP